MRGLIEERKRRTRTDLPDHLAAPIVPMREFIDSPDYLGLGPSKEREDGIIFPIIRDELCDLWDAREARGVYWVVRKDGIGAGKTYFAVCAVMRMLYELNSLVNPLNFYRMDPKTGMDVTMVSVRKTQAADVLYDTLCNMIETSPWFQEYTNTYITKIGLEFTNPRWGKGVIRVRPGGQSTREILSYNNFVAVMDEAAFMEVIRQSKRATVVDAGSGYVYDAAQELHDGLMRRMGSRFIWKGVRHTLLLQMSSPRYPGDFIVRNFAKAARMESQGGPAWVMCHPTWETHPSGRYQGEYFYVDLSTHKLVPQEEGDRLLQEGLARMHEDPELVMAKSNGEGVDNG